MTGLVLGLDGGGTKTVIAVADRTGRVVRWVTAAGLDPTAGDGWDMRLPAMVAGLGPVGAAVLGLPYFSEVPAISARQTEVAIQALGPGAVVVNDVGVAFEGALGGDEGVLILAGTGSMSWARGPRGTVRCGGFGDVFGDEGSAYWIGREALGIVSRHLDGRRKSAQFARGILAALGIPGEGLIDWTYGQTQPRVAIAGLARQVSAQAAGGNVEAIGLLQRAARHLADLVMAAARSAGLPEGARWSYAGGVLTNPSLRNMVADRVGCDPLAPILPPVGGAVLAAARAAGWTCDAGFGATLGAGLRQVSGNSTEQGWADANAD